MVALDTERLTGHPFIQSLKLNKVMFGKLFSKPQKVKLEQMSCHTVTPPHQPDFFTWCMETKVSILAPKSKPIEIRVGDTIRIVDLNAF